MEHRILKNVFDKYKTEDKETLLEIISNQEIKIREIEMLLQYRYETIQNNNKEIERLNNIINELEDSIVGKINVLYQVRGQSNAIQELDILLRQLRELKGDSSNE